MADSQQEDRIESFLASDPAPWINIYIGSGFLYYKTTETPCHFEVGQLSTGDILLLCAFTDESNNVLRIGLISNYHWEELTLRGKTKDGYDVEATELSATSYVPQSPVDVPASEGWDVFRAKQLTVLASRMAKAMQVRFGLTNLDFMGTESKAEPVLSRRLPLVLRSGALETKLTLEHAPEHLWKVRRVHSLRSTDVTAEVSVSLPNNANTGSVTQVVDDLCHILSVARGSKINWVYQSEYNAKGKLLCRPHFSHITRPYAPMALIGPRDSAGHSTKTFVETAYPQYVAKREAYRLHKGIIEAYLEAKAETDCIETRGVKLAVAIEALKAVFLDQPECSCNEFIVDEDTSRWLCKELKATIKRVCPHKKQREDLYGNLLGVNRRSFRGILTELCRSVGLEVVDDIPVFVRCRDSLIHRGEFYHKTADPQQREKHPPHPSIFHEWLFMVNFLDKVFLKLLGYSGPYWDWSEPGTPVHKDYV